MERLEEKDVENTDSKITLQHDSFTFLCVINVVYYTLHGWIKGTKCALFSIKCKGAVWKKAQL